jgi:hypothetical protein
VTENHHKKLLTVTYSTITKNTMLHINCSQHHMQAKNTKRTDCCCKLVTGTPYRGGNMSISARSASYVNASQCNVIHTLPILFTLCPKCINLHIVVAWLACKTSVFNDTLFCCWINMHSSSIKSPHLLLLLPHVRLHQIQWLYQMINSDYLSNNTELCQ